MRSSSPAVTSMALMPPSLHLLCVLLTSMMSSVSPSPLTHLLRFTNNIDTPQSSNLGIWQCNFTINVHKTQATCTDSASAQLTATPKDKQGKNMNNSAPPPDYDTDHAQSMDSPTRLPENKTPATSTPTTNSTAEKQETQRSTYTISGPINIKITLEPPTYDWEDGW